MPSDDGGLVQRRRRRQHAANVLRLQGVQRRRGRRPRRAAAAATRSGAGRCARSISRPGGQDDAALHGVAQLADVARPAVLAPAPPAPAGVNAAAGLPDWRAKNRNSRSARGQNVAAPQPQRRQLHLDHVQAIITGPRETRPAVVSACRSRLVAVRMRTSTTRVFASRRPARRPCPAPAAAASAAPTAAGRRSRPGTACRRRPPRPCRSCPARPR